MTNISSFSLEPSACRSIDTPIASSHEYGDKGSSLAKGLRNRIRKRLDWWGLLRFLMLCAVFPVASRMLAIGLATSPAVPIAIPVGTSALTEVYSFCTHQYTTTLHNVWVSLNRTT